MELRCVAKKHAELEPEDAVLEVKCNSDRCGAGPGVVVIHRWSTTTGEKLDTQRFRNPERK